MLKMNLNVSDLLILMVHALGKLLWLATYEWKGGEVLCRAFNFLSMFTLYLSSNIIVCIAFDRLRTVLTANKIRHGKTQVGAQGAECRVQSNYTHTLLLGGWLAAVLLSLPQLYVWRTVNAFVDHPGGWVQCADIWAIHGLRADGPDSFILRERTKDFYNLSHLVGGGGGGEQLPNEQVLVFYGPLIMLVVCYFAIAVKIMHYSVTDPRLVSRPAPGHPSFGFSPAAARACARWPGLRPRCRPRRARCSRRSWSATRAASPPRARCSTCSRAWTSAACSGSGTPPAGRCRASRAMRTARPRTRSRWPPSWSR